MDKTVFRAVEIIAAGGSVNVGPAGTWTLDNLVVECSGDVGGATFTLSQGGVDYLVLHGLKKGSFAAALIGLSAVFDGQVTFEAAGDQLTVSYSYHTHP